MAMAGSYRKPQPDVYTVLMAIALFALLLGIVFLYLETKDYGSHKTSGRPPVVWIQQTGVSSPAWAALDPPNARCRFAWDDEGEPGRSLAGLLG